MANVYEGKPDGRQFDDVTLKVSRFRPLYRQLTDEEKAQHDAIKDKAVELEAMIDAIATPGPVAGRAKALAMTKLEESIMWAIKGLTA